jgi:hypothetical protein
MKKVYLRGALSALVAELAEGAFVLWAKTGAALGNARVRARSAAAILFLETMNMMSFLSSRSTAIAEQRLHVVSMGISQRKCSSKTESDEFTDVMFV